MIPERAKQLMTFEGYYNLFCELQKYYDYNHRKTYDAVEREYKYYFGVNKYSSFQSFQTVMYRNLKSKTNEI